MALKNYSRLQITIILLLFLSIIVQGLISIRHNSVAWDERCFIGHGKAIFDTGSMKYMLLFDHPPLSYYIGSIFLIPLKFDRSLWNYVSCWDIGNNALFHSGYDPNTILFLSRLPFVLLSVILAVFVLKWASELYGRKSGIAALFLYSFSPSMIAYSSLVLSDFLVGMMVFIATYYFWKLIKVQSKKNITLSGITFGLALLSKTTAVLLFPLFVIIGYAAVRKKQIKAKALAKHFLAILLIAFILVLIFYKFQFGTFKETLPPGHYSEKAREEIGKMPYSDYLTFVYDKVPLPAPLFIGSMGTIFYLSVQKKYGYVFGEITDGVVWYFAALTFLVKTNLALLVMLILLLALHKKLPKKDSITNLSLILPIALVFLIFSNTNKMSGIKHLLPIYPFLFVLASNVINVKIKRKNYFNFLIGILLFFYMLPTILIAPYYLSYINLLGGGPHNGWKATVGSNIDWGQDLGGLKEYMEVNNIEKIKFSYFGSVDPKDYNINYEYMPSPYFQPWDKDYTFLTLENRYENCSERKGIIAISVTNLQNVHLINKTCYNWLKKYEPIKKIGYSIFVYDIK